MLQDRRSSTLSQYRRGFDLRKAAVIVSGFCELCAQRLVACHSLRAAVVRTNVHMLFAAMAVHSWCHVLLKRRSGSQILLELSGGIKLQTYPVQVYGAIMLVFDILVLFLCCRRGARKVSVRLISYSPKPKYSL